MTKPVSYLANCIEGFKARHPSECPWVSGNDQYVSWMLGHWLWITGGDRPTSVKLIALDSWEVNGATYQWLGLGGKDRKKEFIRLS